MRDMLVYLEDILEAVGRIEKSTKGRDKRDFLINLDLQDSILRRLEVIGEAVKHLPEKIRINHPTIPWKSIAGARDILIHAYFDINLEQIWLVVKNDLPVLKKEIDVIRVKWLKEK